MNDRIAKLYDQAILLESNSDYVAGELDPVKFAELIVKECGNWIVNNAGAMEHLGPSYFAKAMQKDFGVKE
jgi:hypothetical protein